MIFVSEIARYSERWDEKRKISLISCFKPKKEGEPALKPRGARSVGMAYQNAPGCPERKYLGEQIV